ncbi:MAG: hypothetical protein R3B99_03195 [Polyangiales bacterium]
MPRAAASGGLPSLRWVVGSAATTLGRHDRVAGTQHHHSLSVALGWASVFEFTAGDALLRQPVARRRRLLWLHEVEAEHAHAASFVFELPLEVVELGLLACTLAHRPRGSKKEPAEEPIAMRQRQ